VGSKSSVCTGVRRVLVTALVTAALRHPLKNEVEAAGIESVNQRRPSRPTRLQSHATPEKKEAKPRLAEPRSTPASVFGEKAAPNRATGPCCSVLAFSFEFIITSAAAMPAAVVPCARSDDAAPGTTAADRRWGAIAAPAELNRLFGERVLSQLALRVRGLTIDRRTFSSGTPHARRRRTMIGSPIRSS
jgi:hypothetical protein